MQNIFETLQRLEPVFHAACPQATVADFERLVAADFWEVGASGRIYDRQFALDTLKNRPAMPSAEMWQTSDYALKVLSEHTFMLTYTLRQPWRTTRRMTIWQQQDTQWQALYHQGTTVTD